MTITIYAKKRRERFRLVFPGVAYFVALAIVTSLGGGGSGKSLATLLGPRVSLPERAVVLSVDDGWALVDPTGQHLTIGGPERGIATERSLKRQFS